MEGLDSALSRQKNLTESLNRAVEQFRVVAVAYAVDATMYVTHLPLAETDRLTELPCCLTHPSHLPDL